MASRLCCFLLAVSVTLLTACASNGKQWNPEDYTAKSGDTVYSIAWRYELEPEAFAAWNGLRVSTFIKPGQRLHTRKPANFSSSYQSSQPASQQDRDIAYSPATSTSTRERKYSDEKWLKAKQGDTLYGISRQTGVSVTRLAQLNQLKEPYTIKPGQTIFLKPLNTAQKNSGGHSKTRAVTSGKKSDNKGGSKTGSTASNKTNWPKTIRWQRPAKGKVIKKYNRKRNDAKGIDIAGKQGDAIVAAAAGKVVYSGDGLISYGNLIIIKHNKTFLSAYAYNRKLLVKEGDTVKAGQKIAEMGHKDRLSSRLHFEIRKNGKPVDPLKYLPW